MSSTVHQPPASLMSQLVLYIKLIHHTPLWGLYLIGGAQRWLVIAQWFHCSETPAVWISDRLPPRGWLARGPPQPVGVPVRRGFMTSYRLKSTRGHRTSISLPGLSGLPAGRTVAPAQPGPLCWARQPWRSGQTNSEAAHALHRAKMDQPGYLAPTASQTVDLLTLERSSTCEFAQEFSAAVCSGGLNDFVGFLTSESEFL